MTDKKPVSGTIVGRIDSPEECLKFGDEWKSLLDQIPGLPISVDPRWLVAWWECFGVTREASIYWGKSSGQLVAVLPLMVGTHEGERTLVFLSDRCSDYLGGVLTQEAQPAVDQIVREAIETHKCTKVHLDNILENDVSLHMLVRSLERIGFSSVIFKSDAAPWISLHATWDDYLVSRSRNTRRLLKKKECQLTSLGELTFSALDQYDHDLWEVLMAMHSERWTSQSAVCQFSDPRRRSFLHKVSEAFADTGQLRVFLYRLCGHPIAYRLGFIKEGRYFDWNTAFDPTLVAHSPGFLLLGDSIKWLYRNGFHEFDFMRGMERYKLSWSTGVRSLYTIEGTKARNHRRHNGHSSTRNRADMLLNKHAAILDLDGVVYRGNVAVTATIEGLMTLGQMGIRVGFLTNTSVKHPKDLASKLAGIGVKCDADLIMTSSLAAADYCQEEGYKVCLVIGGEPALSVLLRSKGIHVAAPEDDCAIDALVVGYTRDFRYEHLLAAQRALSSGASFVCTDRDRLFASANGEHRPGTGWVVSAIEDTTGCAPYIVGKPNQYSLLRLVSRMCVSPEDVILVGDSIEADIVAARRAGMTACLILGGISSAADAAATQPSDRPDIVISDFSELVYLMKGKQDER